MTPREMLARLVAFDTTSALSNLPLIDFVRDYLDGLGIESQLTRNDDVTKANLHISREQLQRGTEILRRVIARAQQPLC